MRSKSLTEFTSYLGNNFPKLSLEEQLELKGPLAVQEGFLALSKMRNDKSPGPDGFSVNFFKTLWREVGHLLVMSLNCGFSKGMLSATQRQGAITLLPKPGKPKEDINSWRPISFTPDT